MNGTLPIKPVLEILQAQNEYVRLRIIEELMESLTPKAHEEAIFLEMEWLSPYGLDRCQEHLDDLRKDIKKDTEKVPEAQDNCIRKGDKVRVTKGADYGHSFIVQGIFAETNGLQIIGEDYTLWDVDYLVKC